MHIYLLVNNIKNSFAVFKYYINLESLTITNCYYNIDLQLFLNLKK